MSLARRSCTLASINEILVDITRRAVLLSESIHTDLCARLDSGMERRGRIQLIPDERGRTREVSQGFVDTRKRRVLEKEGRVEKGRIYPL
jgi:hypothetical protein